MAEGEDEKLRQNNPAETCLIWDFCGYCGYFFLSSLYSIFQAKLVQICHRSEKLKPWFVEDEWTLKINFVVPGVSTVPITFCGCCPVPPLVSLGGAGSIHYREAERCRPLMELSCLTLMCDWYLIWSFSGHQQAVMETMQAQRSKALASRRELNKLN